MYRNNADDLVLLRKFAEKKPDFGGTIRLYRGESGCMSINEKRALALKFSSEKPSEKFICLKFWLILLSPLFQHRLAMEYHEEFFVKDQ